MDSLEVIIAKNNDPKGFNKGDFLPDPFDPRNKDFFVNPEWSKDDEDFLKNR